LNVPLLSPTAQSAEPASAKSSLNQMLTHSNQLLEPTGVGYKEGVSKTEKKLLSSKTAKHSSVHSPEKKNVSFAFNLVIYF